MSYTNGLDDPTLYFNTVLYTGNGTLGHAITGVGHQPDFVWIKNRDAANSHTLHDVVRGVTKRLRTDGTNVEDTTDPFTSFDSDGFTLNSTGGGVNGNTENYVSWNWLASNTTASNTDGSITSTVSANTTSGFSIVSLSGTGSNLTAGHGLGVAPSVIILKARNIANNWLVYHKDINAENALFLDRNVAKEDNSIWFNDTEPTSSVFSLGTWSGMNTSSSTVIAYCFAEKQGFSKFGSYRGNGNADGTFIFTGFRPAFVIIKNSSRSLENWNLIDNKRDGFNGSNENLAPNVSGTESSGNNRWDILSNGFKCRDTNNEVNNSSDTYIYMAFAENPFVTSTGVPATAK